MRWWCSRSQHTCVIAQPPCYRVRTHCQPSVQSVLSCLHSIHMHAILTMFAQPAVHRLCSLCLHTLAITSGPRVRTRFSRELCSHASYILTRAMFSSRMLCSHTRHTRVIVRAGQVRSLLHEATAEESLCRMYRGCAAPRCSCSQTHFQVVPIRTTIASVHTHAHACFARTLAYILTGSR